MLVTYYGEAVQWECDELGHLNMRHYMTKVHQARQFFFIHLGLHEAFESGSPSTVRASKFMVRYLKECRPAERLKIKTGLLEVGETSADLIHIMTHFDETVAAVFVETVDHIYLPTHHKTPKSGSACVLYSAAQSANAYTRLASHHILDPVTGESWASMSASGCLFDLVTRKLVKTSAEQIKRLNDISRLNLRA